MSRTVVIGKTDATITLNKTGVPIRGRSRAVLNLINKDQENEVKALVRAGLLEIVSEDSPPQVIVNQSKNTPKTAVPSELKIEPKAEIELKRKGGRPKGSKNKATLKAEQEQQNKEVKYAQAEQIRANKAEDETQKMGSRVVVQTLDGPRVDRMTNSAAGDMLETEKTKDSIAALKKIELEEKEDIVLPDDKIDDSGLDASDQMGRKATIATEAGTDSIPLVNSILPESKDIRKADPFIDKKSATEQLIKESQSKFEDEKSKDDEMGDAFVEI